MKEDKRGRTKEELAEYGKKTLFSKDRQPSNESKSLGWQRKKMLEAIAQSPASEKLKDEFRELAERMGLDINLLTNEMAMHMRQVEKALDKGDTNAYNAFLDRFIGKPQQNLNVEGVGGETNVYFGVKEDKSSNEPD